MALDEGYGFLYPKKDRKANQPNLTGKALLDGREIEIAAWKKTAKSGVPYLSLKVQDAGGDAPAADPPVTQEDFSSVAPAEDDIPF